MKVKDWRYRLWVWVGVKFLRIPFTVKFTPRDSEYIVGIGFAWTQETAAKMQADYIQLPPKLTRAQRRELKRAGKSVAKDEINNAN